MRPFVLAGTLVLSLATGACGTNTVQLANDAGGDATRDAGRDAVVTHIDATTAHEADVDASASGADADSMRDVTSEDAVVDATPPGPSCGDTPADNGTSVTTARGVATVTVTDLATCRRRYAIASTATRRDALPASPRTVDELAGQPVLRSGHAMFDALYALAYAEVRAASVDSIHDAAFDHGAPLACPSGGCFETGESWPYVWTRDTSYAVALGLAAADPSRSLNSLQFKLSERRGGGGVEVVQDTGTGGSWPVSTDRVVWALGAWELLQYLDGDARAQFRDHAYEALRNTIERDRLVAFDPLTTTYTGETSFLDWREQTYPDWTATDVVHIAMSRSLSTNVLHIAALEITAKLATERGETDVATRYQSWATALRFSVDQRFWEPLDHRFGAFATTTLDPWVMQRDDLLGASLAIVYDVATPDKARLVLENFPHGPAGAPVVFPQQNGVPIYHNRAVWPFVTAWWARAARHGNDARVAAAAVTTLVDGAAMDLSNMENREWLTGSPAVNEGPTSGPVVNSRRQLWSVAGYLSTVESVLFGREVSPDGIRFVPYLPRETRGRYFGSQDTITLDGLAYRGHAITVVLHLPPVSLAVDGAFVIGVQRLDGVPIDGGFVAPDRLGTHSTWDIELVDPVVTRADRINVLAATPAPHTVFAPNTPRLTGITRNGTTLQLAIDPAGEIPGDITFTVYRDGARIAAAVAGTTTSWTDRVPPLDHAPCYAIETTYATSATSSGTVSQHSPPVCFWGDGNARIVTVEPAMFALSGGGTVVAAAGTTRAHTRDWGDTGSAIAMDGVTARFTGDHLVQLVYANGAGPISTGVTCAIKRVTVTDTTAGGAMVTRGYIVMPHTPSWTDWRDSTFVHANLVASHVYRIVIDDDATCANMSAFQHFARYTGGNGGAAGAFSRVDVAQVKLLAR